MLGYLYHPMAHPDTRPISFTCPSVASMWVVTLHNQFQYSDPPLPCHPPSYWLRLFSSQTFSLIDTPTFSTPAVLHTYSPMKMEQSVPKRRHIKFIRWGITQKKGYNNWFSCLDIDPGTILTELSRFCSWNKNSWTISVVGINGACRIYTSKYER